MARKRQEPLTPTKGGYIIESQPMLRPPQGNHIECTEAVHWYYKLPGWVTSKKQAQVFPTASLAVREIGELRRVVSGVEFTLVPIDGGIMYKPHG